MEFPTIDKFAKEVAEKALDEITYEGKTVREWVEIIVKQQPSEDCISRSNLLKEIENGIKAGNYEEGYEEYSHVNNMDDIIECIKYADSVTPQRPKGKWIEYEVDVAPHPLHCSLCGFSNHHISNRYMREFRRCPNCGAEMEGGEE